MAEQIPPEVAKQIADYVFARNKLAAIKLYRDHTGQGLKESKDFVEALEAELLGKEPGKFAPQSAGKGCLGLVVVCGVGMLVALAMKTLKHQ